MSDIAAQMAAEHLRLEAAGLTRACPVCGIEVWNSCYHDGQDVPSIEMAKDAARALFEREREPDALERIGDALERIAVALEAHAPRKAPAASDLPEPLRAEYSDGTNQWGMAHHGRCQMCDSDFPSNASGDGRCRQCGAVTNARLGTITAGPPPVLGPQERVRQDGPD